MRSLTPLEQEVWDWLSDGDPRENYRVLQYGGIAAGSVDVMVWYADTIPFYQRHCQEIDAMLSELCRDAGADPWELFGDNWDQDDPLARDEHNQNLLAWFGFEEAARRIMEDYGAAVFLFLEEDDE